MRYFQKTGMGGVKQICQPIENRPGEYVTLASFANGPLQRHLLACLKEGMVRAGDTLYDLDRERFLVGDVGQLSEGGTLDLIENALRQGYANCGEEADCVYAEPLARLRQWRIDEGR